MILGHRNSVEELFVALPKSLKLVSEIDEEIDEKDSEETLGSIEYLPDPTPTRRTRGKAVRATREEAGAVVVRRVANDIAGAVEMVAALWDFAGDHCCSPVLEEQAKALGKAIAGILKRYPRLLAKMDESDVMSLLLQAGVLTTALKPVVSAIYSNHFKEGKEHDEQPFDQFQPYRPGEAA